MIVTCLLCTQKRSYCQNKQLLCLVCELHNAMESSQESDISLLSLRSTQSSGLASQNGSQNGEQENVVDDGWGTNIHDISIGDFQARNVGPQHDLGHDNGPLDFFSLFWDPDIISIMVTETNR